MKVRVEFTVDVNIDAWAEEYGIEPGEVRRHINDYVRYGFAAHLEHMGLGPALPDDGKV